MAIDGATKLYLLLGNPVSHSLSPSLYNAAFQALGLNCAYLAAPVKAEALPQALSGLKALQAGGANVTSPHKEAVLPFMDRITPEARQIGSVNTIVNREGELCGYSTDGAGFFRHLQEEGLEDSLKEPVLIIGSGGASRAIVSTLACQGARELIIANRTPERARQITGQILQGTALCSSVVLLRGEDLKKALSDCRLLIYSLPLDSPEVEEALQDMKLSFRGKVFYDLRYAPAQTRLMQLFTGRGGKAVNGLGMLLWQAVFAFKLFTGLDAPVEEMRRAVGVNS